MEGIVKDSKLGADEGESMDKGEEIQWCQAFIYSGSILMYSGEF